MAVCVKCGIHVDGDDVYLINGQEQCEECSMVYLNPSQPCGGGSAHHGK
ncbi:MAG: hypothetical protein KGZ96_04835 [Clostridia bacterium]|jgi:hypothetical protein|nr:hypothetical protein [Clostridia bacterium]